MNLRYCKRFYWIMLLLILLMQGNASKNVAQPAMLDESPSSHLKSRINPIDGAEMVFIPFGEFLMGSDAKEIDAIWDKFGWNDEEKKFTGSEQPSHRVRLDGFWIYRNLVTVGQYRNFCAATKRKMPSEPTYGWTNLNPMVNVTWEDAVEYCKWAGGRLPSEAEWEYAARGGNSGVAGRSRTIFVWGDTLPFKPVANLADETFKKTGYSNHPNFHIFSGYADDFPSASPVASFMSNGFGLYDMAGNVLEWCADWFAEDYYRNSPSDNPNGPAIGERRVLRGGAFDTTPTITRIARRLSSHPSVRHDEKGFRCACTK